MAGATGQRGGGTAAGGHAMNDSRGGRYADSRQVGDATVTIISDGVLHWAPQMQAPEAEWRRAMPEADAEGKMTFSMNLVHVSVSGASVLVDLGFDEPTARSHWPAADRSPGLVAGLASIGVR